MKCRINLIDAIAEFLGWAVDHGVVFGMYRFPGDLPDCIDAKFITLIPDEPATQWRTGTPPAVKGWYLVTVDIQDLKSPRHVTYALWDGNWKTDGVVAWMPEPEPYRGTP